MLTLKKKTSVLISSVVSDKFGEGLLSAGEIFAMLALHCLIHINGYSGLLPPQAVPLPPGGRQKCTSIYVEDACPYIVWYTLTVTAKDHSRFSKRKIGVGGDKNSRGVVLVRKPLLFLFPSACRIQAMGFFISDSGTKAWRIVRSAPKVFAELFSKSDNPMQLTSTRCN